VSQVVASELGDDVAQLLPVLRICRLSEVRNSYGEIGVECMATGSPISRTVAGLNDEAVVDHARRLFFGSGRFED